MKVATAVLLCCPVLAAAQTAQPDTPPQNTAPPNTNRTVLTGTATPYLLRPGDSVQVNFRFTPEFDDTEPITPDGKLTLKNLGSLQAAGGTIADLRAHILEAAGTQLVNPEVTVSLKDFERPQFVVSGEVQLPGKFELRKPTTALQAILLAGGPKQDSSMGHVLVFRRISSDTAETHILDLRHLQSAKDRARNDILLQPDDLILVRQDGLATVERYVKIINLGVYLQPLGNNGFF